MEKEFTCPVCGCKKHHRIDVINHGLSGFPDYRPALFDDNGVESCGLRANFDVYVCEDCGHVDCFTNKR